MTDHYTFGIQTTEHYRGLLAEADAYRLLEADKPPSSGTGLVRRLAGGLACRIPHVLYAARLALRRRGTVSKARPAR